MGTSQVCSFHFRNCEVSNPVTRHYVYYTELYVHYFMYADRFEQNSQTGLTNKAFLCNRPVLLLTSFTCNFSPILLIHKPDDVL
jgi:hypothetical protein